MKPWLKPLLVGIYRGIGSFQGVLGGAKWILSIHSSGNPGAINPGLLLGGGRSFRGDSSFVLCFIFLGGGGETPPHQQTGVYESGVASRKGAFSTVDQVRQEDWMHSAYACLNPGGQGAGLGQSLGYWACVVLGSPSK